MAKRYTARWKSMLNSVLGCCLLDGPGQLENVAYKMGMRLRRKPKPGMLLAAAKQFNINLAASYLWWWSTWHWSRLTKPVLQQLVLWLRKGLKNTTVYPDYFSNVKAVNFIDWRTYQKIFKKHKVLSSNRYSGLMWFCWRHFPIR